MDERLAELEKKLKEMTFFLVAILFFTKNSLIFFDVILSEVKDIVGALFLFLIVFFPIKLKIFESFK